MEVLKPRGYQQELIDVAKNANVLITLPTGSGKTLIAAEVIRHKLPALKAAGKAVVFLAPTNPLVEQQCHEILIKKHGLKAIAFHGDVSSHKINTWSADSWQAELSKVDVVVMTPQILMLALCHGSVQMHNLGLLIFDEAHHCGSDHPYAQIMDDFYRHGPSRSDSRPQILGLTASPKGLEGLEGRKKSAVEGLQYRLNAKLITVAEPCRDELRAQVPVPVDELVSVNDAGWPPVDILTAAARLEEVLIVVNKAAIAEGQLAQLQRQATLVKSGQLKAADQLLADLGSIAELANIEDSRVSRVDKQVRAVRTCLVQLGPWAAAAAAYLDLLAGKDAADDMDEHGFGAAAAASGRGVPGEEENEGAAAAAAAGSSVLTDSELWKAMGPDNLGCQPDQLIVAFRNNIQFVHSWLQQTSRELPHIVTPQELAAAAAGCGSSSSTDNWAAAAAGLLNLVVKASVMRVLDVLAGLLILDRQQQQTFISNPGLHAAAGDAGQRSDGLLQQYGKALMAHISFDTLQSQIFPKFASSHAAPAWSGPAPLLSPKLVKLIQHLEHQRVEWGGSNNGSNSGSNSGSNGRDWWSVMVFLETKLATLVICKLVQSLPDICKELKAGYLIGDTDPGGGASSIGMNNKAQAAVVKLFRRGRTNVLFATNIGSEGMDFKQCQAVVAFDPPPEVTPYIQARGRARTAGSHYFWMAPQSLEMDPKQAVSVKMSKLQTDAQVMENHIKQLSAANRRLLPTTSSTSTSTAAAAAAGVVLISPYNPSQHFAVPAGGVATIRQAQVLLAAFCARLPGSDRTNLLQAHYSTKQTNVHGTPNRYQTTVFLPSNSGVSQPIYGPEQSKKPAAKGAAALAAVKELHRIKKLDEWLQPSWLHNRHSQQLEAEPIPKFKYNFATARPLDPRNVNFTPAGSMKITMHLHTFRLSGSSSSSVGDTHYHQQQQQHTQQQQQLVGTKRPLAAITAGLQDVLSNITQAVNPQQQQQQQQQTQHPSSSSAFVSDLLNLAVGAAARCAAVPGSSSSSDDDADNPARVLSFGVLLWEPLSSVLSDGGALRWPAWTHQQQHQPHQVTEYVCPVLLSPSDLLHLLHYQQATDDLIHWSNKRLLGPRGREQQQQQQQQQHVAKPLQPDIFREATRSWTTPAPAAAAAAAAGAAANTDEAKAVQLLAGAQVCYLFVPLKQQQTQQTQQQQTQQQQTQQCGVDWGSIHTMSEGLKSFAQVAQELSGSTASTQHHQIAAAPTTAAAAAEVVPDMTIEQLAAVGSQMLDKVVIAGHSSMLYRCAGIDLNMRLSSPADFTWKCSSSSSGSVAAAAAVEHHNEFGAVAHRPDGRVRGLSTASSHADYYKMRYNVTNLNPDLPMMAVTGGGRGWKKGLGVLVNPLKPPTLQQRLSREVANKHTDLTTPAAAAAAAKLFGAAQQQQQQQGEEQEDEPAAAAAAAVDEPGGSSSSRHHQEYLPLELCWLLPLTAAAWSDLLLLPAFMYRINSMLRTSRLQQQLQQLAHPTSTNDTSASSSSSNTVCPRFPVPCISLLLVAVTGTSAGEVFDLEGLEYLGDVVLKFIATNHVLQAEHLDANEGELSVGKARLVRNVALAAAAQEPQLQLQQHLHLLPYIRQKAGSKRKNDFTPTGWYPGMQPAAAATAAGSRGGEPGLNSVPQAPLGLYDNNMLMTEKQEQGKKLADGVEALIGAVYLTAAAAAPSAAAPAGSGGKPAPVSQAGIAAAAAFCEAIRVMPPGSADLACKPPPLQAFGLQHLPQQQQQQQQQQATLTSQQHHLQERLHHRFKFTVLLKQALTHVSALGAVSYQRLEFLGDAVLDLTVSGWLAHRLAAALRQQQPGGADDVYAPAVLTRARAALVNNTNLGRVAAAAGLQNMINASSRQLAKEIRKFVAAAAASEGGVQDGVGHYNRSTAAVPVVAAAQMQDQAAAAAAATGSSWKEGDCETWLRVWAQGAAPAGGDDDDGDSDDRQEDDGGHAAAGAAEGAAAAVAVATAAEVGAEEANAGSSRHHPKPPKALADLVESIIGAVFVDNMLQQQRHSQESELTWAAVWRAVQLLLKLQ